MTDPPKPKRGWFQYSLRTLLVLVTLFAIACGWYANEMQKAAKRRAAVAEIIELRGFVHYYDAADPNASGEPPAWFSWLRKVHGDKHLGNVVVAGLGNTRITDAGLEHVKGLTSLESLDFSRTQITDAGLVHLKVLTKLEELGLFNTRITDAGLVHLKGLTRLKELSFHDTQITDAGLVHLKGLRKLEWLDLRGTQITDAGLVSRRMNCSEWK